MVHYRGNKAMADDVVRQIESGGGSAFVLQSNLSDPGAPKQFYERLDPELQRRFGSNRFDILVNNAGAGTRAVIEEVSEEAFDETLQVDLKAPFFLIKYASSRLARRRTHRQRVIDGQRAWPIPKWRPIRPRRPDSRP